MQRAARSAVRRKSTAMGGPLPAERRAVSKQPALLQTEHQPLGIRAQPADERMFKQRLAASPSQSCASSKLMKCLAG